MALAQGARLALFNGFRVVRAHAGAGAQKSLDHDHRRCFAHVVGVGLEGQAPDREALAAQVRAVVIADHVEQARLLSLVDALDRFQDAEVVAVAIGRLDDRLHVFRKHDPP